MLDVDALERRWLKYKLKQFLPYLFYPLSVVGVVVLGIFLFKTFQPSPVIGTPTIALKPISNSIASSPKPLLVPANPTETKTVLEPSMQFVQTLPIPSAQEEVKVSAPVQAPEKVPVVVEKEKVVSKQESVLAKKEKIIPKKESVLAKKEVTTLVEPKVKALKPTNKPPLIYPFAQTREPNLSPPPLLNGGSSQVRASSSAQYPVTLDIHEMEDRFKNNNNPYLGLYIARYYYDHGNYNDAYNYALKTNALNNAMEESWLIATKSLVKLGKTDQAKRALQVYVAQSNSERARNLLDSLEGGNR
jgi:hypothetical protein